MHPAMQREEALEQNNESFHTRHLVVHDCECAGIWGSCKVQTEVN